VKIEVSNSRLVTFSTHVYVTKRDFHP